ncbi:putative F-box/LRR-repeat protein At1g56400 [Lycium ferocissimum]|uniref:putative F-box/LRR-repeat protein At1g56400 n=1 Tax=Lycium ferocissimum TaxID=112874 RepID=UPI0028157BC5|nr:putative F-box/LRR-repeat protein At1g56400 [Lycium ferocissimum]
MDDLMPLNPCLKRQKNLSKYDIDNLPDELLIAILSCLNFHEAARTCILSRRWRYLWKHTTCSIEFYNDHTFEIEVAEKFINSVNEALTFHEGAFIERFKVGFVYPTVFPPDSNIDFIVGSKAESNVILIAGLVLQ